MKTCKDCRRLLPLADFYPHPMMGDGHLGSCKDCRRVYARRRSRTEAARERDRVRNAEPHRRRDRQARQRREQEVNPARYHAYRKVRWAIKSGRLTRESCSVCGVDDVQAHHPYGYEGENALRVEWLCQQHHSERHRQYDESALLRL